MDRQTHLNVEIVVSIDVQTSKILYGNKFQAFRGILVDENSFKNDMGHYGPCPCDNVIPEPVWNRVKSFSVLFTIVSFF